MKAYLLFSGSGTLVVLSQHDDVEHKLFLEKLAGKGIYKFIAHEIPLELAKERYGKHFDIATHDLYETDHLRVVDYNGERAMRLFKFSELGPEIMHEPDSFPELF
ncbi:MAG: hypothetical protein M8364_19935 [Methylobacter sp.]|jgi:hypothetical protein|uniref:hypothetical protein n=1 Tax=Methylobacter TaxID=429 RepID=UPI0003794805|nr:MULTISPECIES: hypothetical protein [Methylobacter]MCL7423162.1 hypothetical protein [Methylobacter sp.]